MDPLTHGLLGASLGQALSGPALGRRALVWGAVLGMVPDLDMLARPADPFAEWRWHRGPTHGFFFAVVVGCLLGYLLARRSGDALRSWIPLAVAALLSHPLLDLSTSYGTQLLAPFSDRRFALDWVAIVDPAVQPDPRGGPRGRPACGGDDGCRATRGQGGAHAGVALPRARRPAERAHRGDRSRRASCRAASPSRVSHAFPTLLQLPYRRIVARSGDDVRVGWLSLVRPRPIQWEGFTQARGPLVDAARATPAGRIFEWFAMGEATPRVETRGDAHVVEFDDLRYGLPGCGARRLLGRARRARRRRTAARYGRALRAPAARARLDAALHAVARDARVELGRGAAR